MSTMPPPGNDAITLTPVSPAAMSALQALHDRQMAPYPSARLARNLTDAARNHGAQAVIAWQRGQAVGCAGWVSFGIADMWRRWSWNTMVASAWVLRPHGAAKAWPSCCMRKHAMR